MARWLWSIGAMLVGLGVAANLLGWDALLRIPPPSSGPYGRTRKLMG